ncbi:L,D-transpeptidase family protein [Streptomyces roseicoloratus]|uniref:L,D-transpeptidase family protein n=1 Tax=Streptomyces roseicoloratus TaxID=2508722 RepID=A0ABY9RWX3_9ACTN|nr:L,D-transpeptidase family protein [Streptomyces roseicoloratus]WMX45405.1 L,D-transpeptidase family protein [Streptomyces roseicoloratus]
MKRSSVIRRAVLATAAVVLAAGCTAQAAGSGGGSGASTGTGTGATTPPAGTTAPPATPSSDDKPSATPTTEQPKAKVLMDDGDENEQVRELQARLRQIGYFDRAPTGFYGTMTAGAVKSFQKKRELPQTGTADEVTWQKLVAMTHRPTADELKPSTTNKLDTPDPRCMTGRVMCISKESRTLAWMIDGKVVSSFDVRFGSENTPTREGEFKVEWKARDWTSTIYHTPMPYAMFFSRGQAVHYSADFAARGYNGASHGCVNVRDKSKLAALFDQVKVGDKVVVHW